METLLLQFNQLIGNVATEFLVGASVLISIFVILLAIRVLCEGVDISGVGNFNSKDEDKEE